MAKHAGDLLETSTGRVGLIGGVRSWAHGDNEGWRTIERYNSVDVPAGPPPGERRPATARTG